MPDPLDVPATVGQCGVGSCSSGVPELVETDALCPPGQSCSGSQCVCDPTCPSGNVAGLANDACRFANVTSASVNQKNVMADKAVDGSGSTSFVTSATEATLTILLKGQSMSNVVLWPVNTTVPGQNKTVQYKVTFTTANKEVFVSQKKVSFAPDGPASVAFPTKTNAPIVKIEIEQFDSQMVFGVYEVTFQRCTP